MISTMSAKMFSLAPGNGTLEIMYNYTSNEFETHIYTKKGESVWLLWTDVPLNSSELFQNFEITMFNVPPPGSTEIIIAGLSRLQSA